MLIREFLKAGLVAAITIGIWLGVVAAQGGQILGRVPDGGGCRVTYVYDGDTVALDCGGGQEVTARLVGLDTAETKSPNCPEELVHGQKATDRLRALVAQGRVGLRRHGVDKYRRPLMQMWIDGEDVADILVGEGLAVRYNGGSRPDWCAELALYTQQTGTAHV